MPHQINNKSTEDRKKYNLKIHKISQNQNWNCRKEKFLPFHPFVFLFSLSSTSSSNINQHTTHKAHLTESSGWNWMNFSSLCHLLRSKTTQDFHIFSLANFHETSETGRKVTALACHDFWKSSRSFYLFCSINPSSVAKCVSRRLECNEFLRYLSPFRLWKGES